MTARRKITIEQRRRLLVARHHLGGRAADPDAVVRALVALHATDPASVYVSVLARSTSSTLADVAEAMYGQRDLVRWMAMRRTLFVFSRVDIPMVHAAVSAELGTTLRRRLVSQLERNGTDPPLGSPPEDWLAGLEAHVDSALAQRETATGRQLTEDVPALRTRILARTASERPHNVTTPLLTVMSAAGRIVRATPTGGWTTRQHAWEPVERWWPDGFAQLDPDNARRDLARRWLQRFGPARVEDLQWWTGWNAATTRRALERLPTEPIDLHGLAGIALATDDSDDERAAAEPVATLLPALDPTPMGFKDRSWFLGLDPAAIHDRAGNIGPTVWWDGEVVGSWAVAQDGRLRWRIIVDRGRDARDAVERAAAMLEPRLEGAIVTPAARTPLERSLSDAAQTL